MRRRRRLRISLFFPIVAVLLVVATAVFALVYNGDNTAKKQEANKNAEQTQEPEPTETPAPAPKMLFPFRADDGKWGYKSEAGDVVIQPTYNQATSFSEDRAFVATLSGGIELYALINMQGELLTQPSFNSVQTFSNGFAAVKSGGLWGFINENGTIVIPQEYSNAGDFYDGLAKVTSDNKVGYVSASVGNTGIEIKYDQGGDFSDGQAIVGKKDAEGKMTYFILSKNGETINIGSKEGKKFSQSLASVKITKDEYNFIDSEGSVKFDSTFQDAGNFSENLAPVKKDKKWGYIKLNGEFAIQPKYEEAKEFSNGWAAVKLNGLWGYVAFDEVTGLAEEVIPPRFEEAGSLSGNYSIVRLNNSICVLDKSATFDNLGYTVPIYQLTEEETTSKKNTGTVKVTSGSLNMRLKPDQTSNLLLSISNGSEVEVGAQEGDWLQVTFEGYSGYVLAKHVVVDESLD